MNTKSIFAIAFILYLLLLQTNYIKIDAQLRGAFQIVETENTVEVACVEAGLEKFKVIINKNGGISEVQVSRIPYTGVAGAFIWNLWEQTWNSNPVAPHVIENKGDYVEARFYGKYRDSEIYVNTNYTISKTGLILISSVLEARRDEPTVMQTAWMVYFPVSIFANEKAYIKFEKEIKEINLPVEVTSGSFYEGGDVVYWVDFSKPTEGITFINMAPGSEDWYVTNVRDERQWGYHQVYCAFFAHTGYGTGAMAMGDKRFSKVALYIHGPGGYEGNIEMLNLISDFAKTDVKCNKALKSYDRDTDAWKLASQAKGNINSGLERLVKGDIDGSKTDLENAKKLLEEIEKTAGIGFETLITLAIVLVLIIVVVIVIRRRKLKK